MADRGIGLFLAAGALTWLAVLVRGGLGRGLARRAAVSRPVRDSGRRRPAEGGDADRLGSRLTALARRRRRRGLDLVALLSALAAELEAGQPTYLALEEACRSLPGAPARRARSAARLGGDVAAGLRGDALDPGCSGLRALAACWEVAGRSGAGLAASVRRLAESERSANLARADLLGEVAAVGASAKLLAGLPLLGLALGIGLGADPLDWLLGTAPGRLVMAAGLALQGLGLYWLRRIVARVRTAIS